jgi:hypothetical protein
MLAMFLTLLILRCVHFVTVEVIQLYVHYNIFAFEKRSIINLKKRSCYMKII